MRLLYCTRSDSPHDQRFLKVLAESGHEVYLLRLYRCQSPIPAGIKAVAWKGIAGPLNSLQVPRLTSQLKQLLAELKPDLVHAGPIQDVAYLVARADFHPLLTMSWGFDLMKDAFTSTSMQRHTRFTLEHSDMLTLDCQATADKAVSFGFPAEKICIFPWGVDLNHFSPQNSIVAGKAWRERAGWQNNKVLLCLRSWEPNYGVDVLARAFVQAAEQDPRLRLILMGDGSEAAKIKSILERGGVSGRVIFPGRVPNADLPTYYGAADLYISPSHVDGSSVSLLEAMACGLPALVSDIPANLEWIRHGENGWVFPDGNADSLASTILETTAAELRSFGQEARIDASQKADWSVNAQKLLQCYDMTVSTTQRSKT